ncbi:MAG: hypothetical protein RLZZ592_1668 [Pseudomonadota bacterium]|jgi:hypothetical protein
MLARGLRALLHWTVGLVLLFEEWGWEPLARWAARLARLPLLGRLEARIATLSPHAALAVFVLPGLLLPVKLAAVALVAQGHVAAGIALIVAAKLVGTALVARLYQLVQPALLQLAWFARLHARWIAWKAGVLARLRASVPWRVARAMRRQIRRRTRRWLRD